MLNLFRGQALGLPSGEDVAATVASVTGVAAPPVVTNLSHQAPMWFWFLKEAEAIGGSTLGPVAGRIVAEVLVGLAVKDGSSFLRAQPNWTPNLGTTSGQFTVADLLTVAGLAS